MVWNQTAAAIGWRERVTLIASGGVWGYADLPAVLGDPTRPAHAEMLDWVGGPFDAETFDLAAVNRRLARAR